MTITGANIQTTTNLPVDSVPTDEDGLGLAGVAPEDVEDEDQG